MKKNVLLVGATGFVGSAILNEALLPRSLQACADEARHVTAKSLVEPLQCTAHSLVHGVGNERVERPQPLGGWGVDPIEGFVVVYVFCHLSVRNGISNRKSRRGVFGNVRVGEGWGEERVLRVYLLL